MVVCAKRTLSPPLWFFSIALLMCVNLAIQFCIRYFPTCTTQLGTTLVSRNYEKIGKSKFLKYLIYFNSKIIKRYSC